MNRPLKVGVVAGEESGDLLAADLVRSLKIATGREIELVGVGGRHLEALGLKPLFPGSEIALIGFSAVLRDLPRLVRRIGTTADAIAAARPDCLITVDSPEFSLRVAKQVRKIAPSIPIVHYVCPSVWAWRPGRAKAMKPYVDHVLCLLPFEPEVLKRLDGPPGTFVGHRLASDEGVLLAAKRQEARQLPEADAEKTLLVLPGSRRSEVASLMAPFRETVELLLQRGNRLRLLMPTVPHVEATVREQTDRWPLRPEISTDADSKWRAFGSADAALAASGTVTLELALAGTPLISCYRVDLLVRMASRLFIGWSTSLPNLIADKIVVPELIEDYLRPSYAARHLEALMGATAMRQWQKDGFAEIREKLATPRPPSEMAAEIVNRVLKS